jgi:glycosyltransferase involved in cell wall biosynthesis
MKFSVITPTYKRKEKLDRAINSLLNQTYSNWEMIIVNDSPLDESYADLTSTLTDTRIRYYVNDTNQGVNYSRNFALDQMASDSDWVVFLDDDDYFAKDALESISKLLSKNNSVQWLVTNRAFEDGSLVTKFPFNNRWYSYIRDVLLLKICRGDVTHTIATSAISKIRFSKSIKQAEEWLFYYQLGLHEKFYYHSHNSTLTDGYDLENGLNFRKRSKKDELQTLKKFVTDGNKLGLLYHPTYLMYLCVRIVRWLVK